MYLGGGLPPPPMQTPYPLEIDPSKADPPGYVICDACWEANPPRGQTNSCENITLPQTSFAGGKNAICEWIFNPINLDLKIHF